MKLNEATILIVDDELMLRDIFARWLRSQGAALVLTACDGQEALDLLDDPATPPVHLLITDIRMPRMDGVSLVRALGERGRRLDSIIFVSGFGEIDRREMYSLGANCFLSKPFQLEELQQAVERALTDPAERWLTPFPATPRQSACLDFHPTSAATPVGSPAIDPANATHCSPANSFQLGRGGFCARTLEPLSPGKISFECRFSPQDDHSADDRSVKGSPAIEPPTLHGEGYVRWRSRADGAVGIEFSFLSSPGREWVAACLRREEPFSYIPSPPPPIPTQ